MTATAGILLGLLTFFLIAWLWFFAPHQRIPVRPLIDGMGDLKLCMTLEEFAAGPGRRFRVLAGRRNYFAQEAVWRWRGKSLPAWTLTSFRERRLSEIQWGAVTRSDNLARTAYEHLRGQLLDHYGYPGPDFSKFFVLESNDWPRVSFLIGGPQGNQLVLSTLMEESFPVELTFTARGVVQPTWLPAKPVFCL